MHQDATASPFRRPTDGIKKPIVESDTKRKAVEVNRREQGTKQDRILTLFVCQELKPSSTKKTTTTTTTTTQPTRRSTRLSKTKSSSSTQPTLYDVFSRTRTTRSKKEDDKKRERDDHVSNEPSKKQRISTNDGSSNDVAIEEAPIQETKALAETSASSSTVKDSDSVSKKDDQQHLQEKATLVDLPASPAESPEHHPLIRDTPSPLPDLPPTPSSLGSTSRQREITNLPKPISASQPSDKAQQVAGDGSYITTHLVNILCHGLE